MKTEYIKVRDKRGKQIRGLWLRGEVYYVQIRVTHPVTGKRQPQKFALDKTITTLGAAQLAMAEMRLKERRGELSGKNIVPTFAEYQRYYLSNARKDPKTVANETTFLNDWQRYFGADLRLDKISEPAVRDFINQHQQQISQRTGKVLSNHSLNVRVYALRSMLRMAFEEHKIPRLPFDGIKKLEHKPARKEIPTKEEIEKVIAAGVKLCPKSGTQFADYIRLLMYSGARETEALSLQWSDILWDTRQIHFHRNTKFDKERYVAFNPQLEKLLRSMDKRKQDSPWLFPSPRPNENGGRITNFKSTLAKARKAAGVYLSEHYLRHYFTSMAVMAGVDRFALVEWLGHADGGKLIADTYGHLSNEFNLKQARKLRL